MLINITESVVLKELCKITASCNVADTAEWIEFVFSREAILGFATELLWMYEDINDSKKLVICTHQLEVDPAPNQTVGFYVTPGSPQFVLKVNSLIEKKEEGDEYKNWKEIHKKTKKMNYYYEVKQPFDESSGFITAESYELSQKNIMNINIFNDEGNDITENYNTVIFEINREGIKDFATMLLVWADNYKEGDEYILPHMNQSDCGYNLGVILTRDSIPTKFKCQDLGAAYDYDPRI